MINLIKAAILIRIITNLQQVSDSLYFIGRDIMEIVFLYAIRETIKDHNDKAVVEFCISLAAWNLLKPLFSNPRITDMYEIIGFIIGLIVILIRKYAAR